ncbi:hypothetical protein A2Z33_06455 [Candidatus Gottesmanbacteria bacterium RBG_16_52_11]|uniref:Endonuclease/exonuclease/phosphatase domain-containing protein n=1 Tax=Candidatus Gottesmanbacteria bacterium RBG_16_52_11 TaxID=1798374 RepID=A0A1F5YXK1_9BACT|nr:MAG: hypothetical protein A2Z33_06455 [Candidatus Gottesmanbacteria bacterium RBG_16_52_11]
MSSDLHIVTQNCFYGRTLKGILSLISATCADIYCLQEVTSEAFLQAIRLRTGYRYLMSSAVKSPLPGVRFRNAVLTNSDCREQGEIIWNRKGRKRSYFAGRAFWVTVMTGGSLVRIYNCHLNVTGNGMTERRIMLTGIIRHADTFRGPVIICGDMNTVIPDRHRYRFAVSLMHRIPAPQPEIYGRFADLNERYYFYDTAKNYGFEETADLSANTWRMPLTQREAFGLKLDWILYRGLVKIRGRTGGWIGDHRAVIGEFAIRDNQNTKRRENGN